MKASEFVKKFGWDKANSKIKLLNDMGLDMWDFGWGFYTNDLKRLVESHELVEKYGGLEKAKDNEDTANDFGLGHKGLKQAIADVESCQ